MHGQPHIRFAFFHLRVSEWTNRQFRNVFVSHKIIFTVVCMWATPLWEHFRKSLPLVLYTNIYITGLHWRSAWHLQQSTRKVATKDDCIDTTCIGKGKSVPLQAWSGPEGSRNLRFPDFVTTARDGGKVVSHTHRPLLPPRKYSWYSFRLEAESTPGS